MTKQPSDSSPFSLLNLAQILLVYIQFNSPGTLVHDTLTPLPYPFPTCGGATTTDAHRAALSPRATRPRLPSPRVVVECWGSRLSHVGDRPRPPQFLHLQSSTGRRTPSAASLASSSSPSSARHPLRLVVTGSHGGELQHRTR
jgi:hypothetical protein